MKISIVIPCLNEHKTIIRAVSQAILAAKKAKLDKFEVIVADNGSDDGSVEKVLQYKKKKRMRRLKLIHVPLKGYGAALHFGILSAKYPYVFFADSDLSYSFLELKKFLPLIDQEYDLVLGSRFSGKIYPDAMPFLHQYFGTPLLSFIVRLLYRIPISDTNSGMRVVKKNFYKKLMIKNSGMEWASELLIKTSLQSGKFAEVPISFRKDKRDKKPHLNSWVDGWRHLKVIVLLKPQIFVASILFTFLLSIIFIFRGLSWRALVWFLFFEFFVYAFLALKKLEAAINKQENYFSQLLDRVPLVIIGIVLTILGFFQALFWIKIQAEIKFLLLFHILWFDLWLFFIETIKTHVVNRLPDDLIEKNNL